MAEINVDDMISQAKNFQEGKVPEKCDQPNYSVRPSHNYCTSQAPKSKNLSLPKNLYSSEAVLPTEYVPPKSSRKRDIKDNGSFRSLGEYYKKYEHDEVPVKDSEDIIQNIGDKGSLTDSELDNLESKLFENLSQELQFNDYSNSSLEYNIKFFRTTVQEIFDNFYANMRDFELYKKRFNEILEKRNEDAIADMEDFIKDMIQHIMSSETLISNDGKKSNDVASSFEDKETNISNSNDESSYNTINSAAEHSVIEAYKNDNYFTDSTLDDNTSKANIPTGGTKDETFNIFLLGGNSCVQIKMNERNLFSEINIKKPIKNLADGKHVASAENMERLAAKKMELEKYVKQQQDCNVPDREIPVKISYAKKNIHLNEDFSHDRNNDKSFIAKLCNFLCRKFRKTI